MDKKYHKIVAELFDKKHNETNDFFNALKKRHIQVDNSTNIDNIMNEMNNGIS